MLLRVPRSSRMRGPRKLPIEELYLTQAAYEATPLARELDLAGIPCYLVEPRTAQSISDVDSPSGILAVAPIRPAPLEEVLQLPGPLLLLADLNDPANAGGLLRSADAFGCRGVLFGTLGVDPYHPKVVRGSMGAAFRLALASIEPQELGAGLQSSGRTLLGLEAGGERYRERDVCPGFSAGGRPRTARVGSLGSTLQPLARHSDERPDRELKRGRSGVDRALPCMPANARAGACAIVVKRVLLRQKVKTTGAPRRMLYSAHSRRGAAWSRRLRRRLKRYGNVQSLLEAFRPNGFHRRLSGLSKATRITGTKLKDLERSGPKRKIRRRFLEAPGNVRSTGRFALK